MNQEKYIGMDVHQATISVAVMDGSGKLIMECLLETQAATIVEFIRGLHGTLSLTFEEGTAAAWLHDLLKPHVSRLVQIVHKGDVIKCLPGVEHWHGASPKSGFAYLAVTPTQKGKTIWLEPVSDKDYNSLK
jgi:hypothetical protein